MERIRLGAHHLLYQEPNRVSAVTRSPLGGARLFNRTLRALECEPLRVGGVGDHVHILAGLSRKISLAELVKNLKTSSTTILKNKGHSHFGWQSG